MLISTSTLEVFRTLLSLCDLFVYSVQNRVCQIKVSASAYMGDDFGATFVRVISWLDLVLGAGRGGQIARLGLRTGRQAGSRANKPNGHRHSCCSQADYPEQQ